MNGTTLVAFATTISAPTLRQIVSHCHPTRDTDSEPHRNPGIKGVRLEFDGADVTGIATDGRAMVIVEGCHSLLNGDELECFTVDLTKLYGKRASLNARSNLPVITKVDGGLRFAWTNDAGGKNPKHFEVTCPFVEGRFPNWKQIPIPAHDYDTRIRIEAGDWVEQFKPPLQCSFQWQPVVKAKSIQMARPVEKATFPIIEFEGVKNRLPDIMLDMDRLIDILKRMSGPVDIRLKGWGDPIRISVDGVTYFLMPLARRDD